MLKLNDRVSLFVGTKTVKGTLVGIDNYVLENFDGGESSWPSYTFVSPNAKPFDRYWAVLWDKSQWILWTATKKTRPPISFQIVMAKSGIAHIKFRGDSGPSSPTAALMQYKKGYKYFCMERFQNSDVLFFEGRKINKPKVL